MRDTRDILSARELHRQGFKHRDNARYIKIDTERQRDSWMKGK